MNIIPRYKVKDGDRKGKEWKLFYRKRGGQDWKEANQEFLSDDGYIDIAAFHEADGNHIVFGSMEEAAEDMKDVIAERLCSLDFDGVREIAGRLEEAGERYDDGDIIIYDTVNGTYEVSRRYGENLLDDATEYQAGVEA